MKDAIARSRIEGLIEELRSGYPQKWETNDLDKRLKALEARLMEQVAAFDALFDFLGKELGFRARYTKEVKGHAFWWSLTSTEFNDPRLSPRQLAVTETKEVTRITPPRPGSKGRHHSRKGRK